MKKKLLSIFMVFCMILPFAFTLTACGDDDDNTTTPTHTCTAATEWTSDDTHHWHKCTDATCTLVLDKAEHTFTETTVDATIDADGKTTKTCSVCSKTIETTIPKLTQTKDEMIAVLANAVKEQNYSGNIQETSYYEKTSDDTMVAPADVVEKTTDYLVKKADGTMVYYEVDHNNPDGFEGEYIPYATYAKSVNSDNFVYYLDENELTHVLEGNNKATVGENYTQNYTIDSIYNNLDYLLNMHDEESMETTLKGTLAYYIDMYRSILSTKGIIFNYDKDDIVVNTTVTYSNGIYTAVGTIVLSEDKVIYEGTPALKIKDFLVEFTVEYKNDLVIRNDSKFIYNVEQGGLTTQYYIINNYAYTTDITEAHFTKIATVAEAHDYSGSEYVHQEDLNIYVNDVFYSVYKLNFGSTINDTLDTVIAQLTTSIGAYSTITTIVNDAPYVPTTDVVIEDFYGKDVYITIDADDGYTLIMKSYLIVEETYMYEMYRTNILEMVETSGSYTIDTTGDNPDYHPEYNPSVPQTIPYEDKITLNNAQISNSELTFNVTEKAYYIELSYYVSLF